MTRFTKDISYEGLLKLTRPEQLAIGSLIWALEHVEARQ